MLVHHRVLSMHEAPNSITTSPEWDASPSQGAQHEAPSSITTPPGWDASLSRDKPTPPPPPPTFHPPPGRKNTNQAKHEEGINHLIHNYT